MEHGQGQHSSKDYRHEHFKYPFKISQHHLWLQESQANKCDMKSLPMTAAESTHHIFPDNRLLPHSLQTSFFDSSAHDSPWRITDLTSFPNQLIGILQWLFQEMESHGYGREPNCSPLFCVSFKIQEAKTVYPTIIFYCLKKYAYKNYSTWSSY